MRATIGKAFKFEAAHQIPWHTNPDGSPGKCSQLHGHSYHGMVYLNGVVDDLGWVKDFHLMAKDMEFINDFDHQFLNYMKPFQDGKPTFWATTEHVAMWILIRLRAKDYRYVRVKIAETDTTEVIVEAEDL